MRFIDPAQDPWRALSDDGERLQSHLLLNHEQWRQDLAANGGTPGQAGYGLMAWLVLHRGWFQWLGLDAPE